MQYKLTLSLFTLVFLSIISCEKDKVAPEPVPINTVIAPCTIPETKYDLDSVYYGPSASHPEAKYRIKFMDTSSNGAVIRKLEYGFNKIPISGKYNFVYNIDTNNLNNVNQIAFVRDSGSFLWRSANTENQEVYFEKNNQEIIISYCNFSNTSVQFNPVDQCYVGNRPASFKIRKQF